MRHRKQKKLKMGYDASRRIIKALSAGLILHEKVVISTSRARLVKAKVEKLVTLGKRLDLHAKRQLFSALPKSAARKVFEVLGPKYAERQGGYLRSVKVKKAKDGTNLTQLEFV